MTKDTNPLNLGIMSEKLLVQRRIAFYRFSRQLKKWVKTPRKLHELTDIHISTCYDYFNQKAFPKLENQLKIKEAVGQISFDYCFSGTCLSDEHERKKLNL